MDFPALSFRIITSGSCYPPLIFRHFRPGDWIVFFENEAGTIARYNGRADTPEEALELFLKYRIDGEPAPADRMVW